MLGQNGHTEGDKELRSVLHDLRKDIESLRSDVSSLRKDTVALGKAGAKSAAHKVGDGVDKVSHAAKAKLKDTTGTLDEVTQDLRTTVTENPITSLAAAVALGFAMGRGLFRH